MTAQSERSPDDDSHMSTMRILPIVLLCRSRHVLLKIGNIRILPVVVSVSFFLIAAALAAAPSACIR